jgi:hypothetical protein
MSNFKQYDVAENGHKQASPPPRSGFDPSLLLIKLGGWLAVIAFGGLFWLVNGGFSVLGLEVVSKLFGTGGAIFWGFVSAGKLPIGAGIPPQPIVPWLGVVAATFIQIGITWRAILRKPIPVWVIAIGVLLSGYDVATTFFGFGTLQWVQQAGPLAQIPLTLLFTFGLELLVGYLLRNKR